MKNGKIVVARLFSKYLGGSGGFVSQRMKMVDRDRFETISIYLSRLSDVPNELAEDGIECFYLSDAPLTSFRYSVLRRLQRVLREQAVDILQCNRHKATFYGALAARSGRVSAVISHVHGLNRCKNAGRRLMYRHLLSPRISCAMGCAEAVRDDIRKNYPGLQKKAMSLANSIDYDKYANAQIDKAEYRKALGLSPDSYVFVFVGRLVPTKGLGYLTEAFAAIAKSNERAHLLIVGDGRYGRLIPSRDAVSLADAMSEMLAMEQPDVDALTTRARTRIIENHSHQRLVAQLERVYERLLAQPGIPDDLETPAR